MDYGNIFAEDKGLIGQQILEQLKKAAECLHSLLLFNDPEAFNYLFKEKIIKPEETRVRLSLANHNKYDFFIVTNQGKLRDIHTSQDVEGEFLEDLLVNDRYKPGEYAVLHFDERWLDKF